MNASHNLPLHTLSTRRPLQRNTLALAALLLSATGAFAQPQAPQSAPSSATAAPQGRTRAEVIAELQCARASGELDAEMLRSYSLPAAPRPSATPSCGHAGSEVLTGAAPHAAQP